jgi:ATP-binding cassette subfamily B protein
MLRDREVANRAGVSRDSVDPSRLSTLQEAIAVARFPNSVAMVRIAPYERAERSQSMNARPSLRNAIVRLWRTLNRRRRTQFYVLVVCMVLASFAEVFSLGLIVPFLAALTAPDRVLANGAVQKFLSWTPWIDRADIVLWLAGIFCVFTLLAAAFRLLLLYASTGFAFALGADLSLEVYRRTLYQPYAVHIGRNSAEVIDGVTYKANAMTNNVVSPMLVVASSTFMLVGVLATLFAISPIITMSAAAAFAVIYGGVLAWSRRQLRHDSQLLARESTQVHKALQEGLGGIRDVLLDGTQEVFSEIYRVSDRRVRAIWGRQILVAGSPRFVVEGLGMIAIAILAVAASHGGSDPTVVPVLGALALGAQRLLPVVQQTYSAIVTIRGAEGVLWEALALLEQPMPHDAGTPAAPIPFSEALELRNIGFRYAPGLPLVLEGVSLTIRKGERIGIFGPTGGGKSTLLDLIMGLLTPSSGALLVDGAPLDEGSLRGWQRHVAHVPQSIYLTDAPVSENIAFGQPKGEIDMERVRDAARIAQLQSVIERLPQGFDTQVGERGVRLSGGQRQRLGIARALYKRADVIVFDEATSALDTQTEQELMAAINALSHDLTIIMVAHRLTTLRECDYLIEIADGRVVRRGSYTELVDSKLAKPAVSP